MRTVTTDLGDPAEASLYLQERRHLFKNVNIFTSLQLDTIMSDVRGRSL